MTRKRDLESSTAKHLRHNLNMTCISYCLNNINVTKELTKLGNKKTDLDGHCKPNNKVDECVSRQHKTSVKLRRSSDTIFSRAILTINILFYSILFYSILFYSILFYSILFYSILFYSILFYSILFYSILLYYILFHSILFYSILFYSILFYSFMHYLAYFERMKCYKPPQ